MNWRGAAGSRIRLWSEELREFEWSNLSDLDTVGVWPAPVKSVIAVVIFLLCLGAGYWFHVKDLQARLDAVVRQEQTLRADFESKAVLAAHLEAYREQMAVMEESFGTLLGQLPGETEVPGLLEDISATGTGSGLEFANIALQDERAQEYYIELPISIAVSGGYHDFGTFVSGVASLPRIVTLHDFNIVRAANRGNLSMTISARTYRYRPSDE